MLAIGTQARFDCPAHFAMLPEYGAHAGQLVEVVRPCTAEEADGPETGHEQMYVIRAADGWTGEAWESELHVPARH